MNHGDVDMVTRKTGSFDANTALQALVAQVGTPRPGGDHQMHLVAFGRNAQLFRTNPRQRANVATGQLVGAHHIQRGLHHLRWGERDFHAQDFGAVEQALGVLFQAEHAGAAILQLVGAYAFKRAAAVVQGVGQHMDFGIAPFDHLTIHPDFAVAVI